MVKLWHPDRFASDSTAYPDAVRQTQRINAAYRLLAGDAGRQEAREDLAEAFPSVDWNGRRITTLIGSGGRSEPLPRIGRPFPLESLSSY